jgi:hypothetical protein
MRYASVTGARSSDEVAAYMPGNYEVYGHRFPDGGTGRLVVLIRGEDNAGWTLDDYVIPRLASGLMACREITIPEGDATIPERLEALRAAIQAESISYGEIAELQSYADFIPNGDVELLQWAGVLEEEIV